MEQDVQIGTEPVIKGKGRTVADRRPKAWERP